MSEQVSVPLSPVVPSGAGAFTSSYRTYAIALLTLTYTANFVDRQILSVLLQPIKAEMHLSDTQLGFLSGLTFALFYASLGIPIARWADRGNRRNIMSLALTIFSAMTVVCGFAANYWQLVVARIGVGVGEAGANPPSQSIISDMFPPEKRATAMGIYTMGINFGILIGFLVGGWISQWWGWRAAFFVVGIPSLLIALLTRLTLREPRRGAADGLAARAATDNPTFGETVRFLWSQRSFRQLCYGGSLAAFAGYASTNWMPAFLARSFHMRGGEIGTSLALSIGIAGGAGTFLLPYLADKIGRHDVRRKVWLTAAFCTLAVPFLIALYLSSDKAFAFAMFLVPCMAGAAYAPVLYALTQSLVTLRMRATAAALLLFVINLIGIGLGPQMTGILSDLYTPRFGPEALRYALLTVSFAWAWAGVHFALSARTLAQDIERARLATG